MLVTVALALVLGSGVARADDLNLGGIYNSGITLTGGNVPGTYGGGSITPSHLNGVLLPWVYCVDVPDEVGVPADYANAIVTHNGMIAGSSLNSSHSGIASYAGNGALATVNNEVEVAWLLHSFATLAGTDVNAQIALQAAIWYVIYGSALSGPTAAVSDYNKDLDALHAAGSGLTNYTANYDWLSPSGNSSSVDQGLVTYDPVPDGGMTVMLLGGALVGLAVLRRKFGV